MAAFRAGQARASSLLDEVGLSHRKHARPGKLSVGERQRVAIARALANEPTLILADEPTGNLDSKAQKDVLDLLDWLRRERSLTLIVVTHSQEVAAASDPRDQGQGWADCRGVRKLARVGQVSKI